jgi:hypothetical protein
MQILNKWTGRLKFDFQKVLTIQTTSGSWLSTTPDFDPKYPTNLQKTLLTFPSAQSIEIEKRNRISLHVSTAKVSTALFLAKKKRKKNRHLRRRQPTMRNNSQFPFCILHLFIVFASHLFFCCTKLERKHQYTDNTISI